MFTFPFRFPFIFLTLKILEPFTNNHIPSFSPKEMPLLCQLHHFFFLSFIVSTIINYWHCATSLFNCIIFKSMSKNILIINLTITSHNITHFHWHLGETHCYSRRRLFSPTLIPHHTSFISSFHSCDHVFIWIFCRRCSWYRKLGCQTLRNCYLY